MKKLLSLLTDFVALIASVCVFAKEQKHLVTGKVTTEDGVTMTSVTVKVKFMDKKVYTDLKGRYQIDVPMDSTLIFSFPNFKTQEIKVLKDTIDVVLKLQ